GSLKQMCISIVSQNHPALFGNHKTKGCGFNRSFTCIESNGRTINGVGEEIHQYLFSVQKNRKQVNFPVKLKSTKTKFRREITCLTLMILNYYLIYKTKILY